MTNTFRVGDRVYCPKIGTGVYIVERKHHNVYRLSLRWEDNYVSFTPEGREYTVDPLPLVFHATEENQQLLSKLYDIAFDTPVQVKPAKGVIEAMLADGWANVPCYLSDQFENPTNKNCIDFVVGTRHGQYVTSNGMTWYYAVPIDPKSGKRIIDYVDSEVVTE